MHVNSLEKCAPTDILDVVANHEFALIRREGRWQVIGNAGRSRLKEDLERTKDRLDKEVEAMKRLHQISLGSIKGDELTPLLEDIVDAAIFIMGADKGNIQLLDSTTGKLHIIAHRGFDDHFLTYFNGVHTGQASCGTALKRGARVVVRTWLRTLSLRTPRNCPSSWRQGSERSSPHPCSAAQGSCWA